MKKLAIGLTTMIIAAISINVFGKVKAYTFLGKNSGKGKRAFVFIPGFNKGRYKNVKTLQLANGI